MSKKCTRCKKTLEFDNFDLKKDGSYYAHCKPCKIKHQQSYHKNKKRKSGYCLKCFEEGVFKRAGYGMLDDKKKISCSKHKSKEMVDLAHISNMCALCLEDGKKTRCSYGLLSDGKKVACALHKTEDMIDLVNIKYGCIICNKNGIFKQATFGLLSDKKKTHCSKHKLDDMIDLNDIKRCCIICKENGKLVSSSFGFSSDNKRTHCSKHKLDGMINLSERCCIVCKELGVIKECYFGFASDNKRTHCSKHKLDGMIDLAHRNNNCIVCADEGKIIRGTFGFKSDGKVTHCSKHKSEKMVDLVHIKNNCIICTEKGIVKRASFGLISDMKKTHCGDHKSSKMIDLLNVKNNCIICNDMDIFKRASFGYLSDKKKTHCVDHMHDGMINLTMFNRSCVVCSEEGIIKSASFGYLFEKKTHCAVHKKSNMFRSNYPTCEECPNKPLYGDTKLHDIPVRCEEHKLDSDVDLISRKCDLCGDDYFIPSTETKCRGCLGFVKRKESKRGVKERKIADLLTSLSSKLGTPVHDKKVKDGCSKKRPDFYYKDFNPLFDLIVEVDENQHSKYTCGIQAEMQRIISIYENDNGGFPLCIVRFNPDSYYYKDKVVKVYKGREDTLKNVICGLKNRTEFKHKIGVIYLFYDQFDTITGIEIESFDYKYEKGNVIINHKHPLSEKKEHIYSL